MAATREARNDRRTSIKAFFLILHAIASRGQCVYQVTFGRMSPIGDVTEARIVLDFERDCELLCYKSSTCSGANARRLDNGTVLCEFRSVVIDEYTSHLLLAEEGSKYFAKEDAVLGAQHVNQALFQGDVACTAGSALTTNVCEKGVDGSVSTLWLTSQFEPGPDTWIEIVLNRTVLVYRVGLIGRCISAALIKAVSVNFTDGSTSTFSDLLCTFESCNEGDSLIIPAVVSQAARVTINERCSTEANSNYLGLKEVNIYGFTDT